MATEALFALMLFCFGGGCPLNMAGTTAETQEGATVDTQEGTSAGYLPPCREAGLFIAPCPRCGREMRLKTLRYSHVCGRSFDPAQRALEQQAMAEKAINDRMALLDQPAKRHVERTAAQPTARDYSNLLVLNDIILFLK